DGNLQFSRDGGQTWKNIVSSVPGVPKGTYVSRIVASKYNEGTAYVAFDGHRSNDFHVYLFKTTNFGGSWNALTNGITDASGTLSEDLHVFPIRNTIAWRMANNTWFTAQQYYAGPNPPYGGLISFYLKTKPAEKQKVKITVTDANGKTVREIDYDKAEAGVNRINWDLRYDP